MVFFTTCTLSSECGLRDPEQKENNFIRNPISAGACGEWILLEICVARFWKMRQKSWDWSYFSDFLVVGNQMHLHWASHWNELHDLVFFSENFQVLLSLKSANKNCSCWRVCQEGNKRTKGFCHWFPVPPARIIPWFHTMHCSHLDSNDRCVKNFDNYTQVTTIKKKYIHVWN